jgi:hypothetical protein
MTDVYEFSEYERESLIYRFTTMTAAEVDAAKTKLAAHEKEQAEKKASAPPKPAAPPAVRVPVGAKPVGVSAAKPASAPAVSPAALPDNTENKS